MASYDELGALLRESRLNKGMSLGQLASAVGRSSSSVRRWERGEVAPAATVLPKLAAILEIDSDDLDRVKPSFDSSDTEQAGDQDSGADETGEDETGEDERVSTVEQSIVVPEETIQPTPEVPEDRSPRGGLFADVLTVLTGGTRSWVGWIRGLLTAAVLIVMLLILAWAIGELFDALGDVWDSFEIGTNGTPVSLGRSAQY